MKNTPGYHMERRGRFLVAVADSPGAQLTREVVEECREEIRRERAEAAFGRRPTDEPRDFAELDILEPSAQLMPRHRRWPWRATHSLAPAVRMVPMSVLPRMRRLFVVAASAVLALAFVGTLLAESTPVPSPTATATQPAPPAPSGTPWPPPTGLAVRVESILLGANNRPLPPEKQTHTAVVTWALMPGFTGVYEVERGTAAIGSSAPRKWELAGTVAATEAVDGVLRWTIAVQPLSLSYCFRVRTVIASAPGPETGPYSEEACLPVPPSTGGQAPLPPDVGNGALPAGSSGSVTPWVILVAVLAATGSLGAALAVRAR